MTPVQMMNATTFLCGLVQCQRNWRKLVGIGVMMFSVGNGQISRTSRNRNMCTGRLRTVPPRGITAVRVRWFRRRARVWQRSCRVDEADRSRQIVRVRFCCLPLLVNRGSAKGQEIPVLVESIRVDVVRVFGAQLDPEPIVF